MFVSSLGVLRNKGVDASIRMLPIVHESDWRTRSRKQGANAPCRHADQGLQGIRFQLVIVCNTAIPDGTEYETIQLPTRSSNSLRNVLRMRNTPFLAPTAYTGSSYINALVYRETITLYYRKFGAYPGRVGTLRQVASHSWSRHLESRITRSCKADAGNHRARHGRHRERGATKKEIDHGRLGDSGQGNRSRNTWLPAPTDRIHAASADGGISRDAGQRPATVDGTGVGGVENGNGRHLALQ